MSTLKTDEPPVAAFLEGKTTPAADAASRRVRSRRRTASLVQGQGLLLMAIVVCVYFSFTSPYFFTWSNALTIGAASAALGVMALAQTHLIISGGMDLSVGSVVSLTNIFVAISVAGGLSFWIAAPLAVLIGAAIGGVNAVLVVALKVNPFIATLGSLSVVEGIALAVTGGETRVVTNPVLEFIAQNPVLGLPVSLLIFLVLFAIALVVERLTPWGRTIFAIGGNPEAARLSGLHVRGTQAALFVISGASGGLAGVLVTSQLASGSPQVGTTFLLSVVTAVILGGTSLSGGRGTVIGTLIAVIILGMLNDGFALLGWTSAAQQVALGVALIIAVLIDQISRRLRSTR